jgi:hypothetical protein
VIICTRIEAKNETKKTALANISKIPLEMIHLTTLSIDGFGINSHIESNA